MAKNENPEMPEISRKPSKLKEHPELTVYLYLKTAKKQSLLSKYNFGFNQKNAFFKLSWIFFLDYFEQHFES